MSNYKVILLASAQQDLRTIADYLDENFGVVVKIKVMKKMKQRMASLHYFPRLAPVLYWSEEKAEWRKLLIKPYVAIYQLQQTTVLIYRIFHMAQDYSLQLM